MSRRRWVLLAAIVLAPGATRAQDRLKAVPGYDQYERMAREIPSAVRSGALTATWSDDGRRLEYTRNGETYRFDVATRRIEKILI